MKLKNILKRIEKRLGELPACYRVDVGDRKLYRFIRDQFDGHVASEIDHHYGLNLPIAITCDIEDRNFIGVTLIPTREEGIVEGPMLLVHNSQYKDAGSNPNIEYIEVNK